MATRSLIGGAALLAVLGMAACGQTSHRASGDYRFTSATTIGTTIPVQDRKPAGDFTGGLLSGGSVSLSQDAGKVVVVNFWAQWCGPCKVETPQFDRMYRADRSQGVDFIGIDTKDIRGMADAFVHDNQITYPIVYDEEGRTALELGKLPDVSLPFSVLVDKHQRMAAVYLGAVTPKDLQPVLDRLSAES